MSSNSFWRSSAVSQSMPSMIGFVSSNQRPVSGSITFTAPIISEANITLSTPATRSSISIAGWS